MQEITIQTNDLLSIEEARAILQYSRVHMWRLAKQGKLRPIYFGNRPFFSRKEIEAYRSNHAAS